MKGVWKSDLTITTWNVGAMLRIKQWMETMQDREKWRQIVE